MGRLRALDGDRTDARDRRGRHRAARQPPRRGRRAPAALAPGRPRPRRHRLRHPRTLLAPRPHPAVRRRADRRRRHPGGRRRSRTPTPTSPGRASTGCATRASTSTVGVHAAEVRDDLAPYLLHRTQGRAFTVVKTAMSLDGRIAARDGSSQWITSPAGPRRRARACAPTRRRSWSAPAPRSPTGRSLTVRDVASPARTAAAARRARRPRSRPRRRSALRHRRRAHARGHHAGGVRRRAPGLARRPGPRCSPCPSPATTSASTSSPRSRRSPASACCRCSWRAARHSPARCSQPGLADRVVTYVAPTLLGRDGRPAFDVDGPATIADAAALASSPTSAASVPTSASTTRPPAITTAGEGGLMFTGIVEELGTVRAIVPNEGGARIEIDADHRARPTPRSARRSRSTAAASPWWSSTTTGGRPTRSPRPSTARRSARSPQGAPVNLERPMAVDGRFGGHVVQGHVDGVGTLSARATLPDGSTRMTFTPPRALLRYVVEKGSITVDGISLTVASLDDAAGDVRRRRHPAHPVRHHARAQAARRPGQPRGRRARQVRRAAPGHRRSPTTVPHPQASKEHHRCPSRRSSRPSRRSAAASS